MRGAPTPASRACRVAGARRDVLSSMVPEGAEDNVDALQRATERLETDAARTRRDLLIAASRVLGDGAVAVGDDPELESRDARVIAALVELVPNTAKVLRQNCDSVDGKGNMNGGIGDDEKISSSSAQLPSWASSSNASTKLEDSAIAQAAFRLQEARTLEETATATAARQSLATRTVQKRTDVETFLATGDLKSAADSLRACSELTDELNSMLQGVRSKGTSTVGTVQDTSTIKIERDRCAFLTEKSNALVEKLVDKIRSAFSDAMEVVDDENNSTGASAIKANPHQFETVWSVLQCSDSSSSTDYSTLKAELLTELNDQLAMELFLPLVDAAVEDGSIVTAFVDATSGHTSEEVSTHSMVFRWTVEESTHESEDPSATAASLATALDVALTFAGDSVKLSGRPIFAKEVLASTWDAVAAACSTKWFENSETNCSADSSNRLTTTVHIPLTDDAVASLCAVEASAAKLGASPAFPAIGPVESAAFDLERRAAEVTKRETVRAAAEIVTRGGFERGTLRVKGGSDVINATDTHTQSASGFGDELGFAERVEKSLWAETGVGSEFPVNCEFPACTITQTAVKLSVLASATLAKAHYLRKSVTENSTTTSPAQKRAALLEAATTAQSACDVLEYWRCVTPIQVGAGSNGGVTRSTGMGVTIYGRSTTNYPDDCELICRSGPYAAVSFRNDAYFLCDRFLKAKYVFESADEASDKPEGPSDDLNSNINSKKHSDALLWVVPPLLKLGDDTIALLMRTTLSETEAELTLAGNEFISLGESEAAAVDATRAIRRARRVVGRVCAALVRGLPVELGVRYGVQVLSKYAETLVSHVFSCADVSVDACDALRELLTEAFAAEGLFPLKAGNLIGGNTGSTGQCGQQSPSLADKKLSAVGEVTALLEGNKELHKVWSKGVFLANLFRFSLSDIEQTWSSGTLESKGFTSGEITKLVTAVFENSDRRERALGIINDSRR